MVQKELNLIKNIPFNEFNDPSLMSDQDRAFERYMEQLGSEF